MFTAQISVVGANTKGGREGEIGKVIIFTNLANECFDCLWIPEALAYKSMKDRPTRVLDLDVVLEVECFKNIIGEVDG